VACKSQLSKSLEHNVSVLRKTELLIRNITFNVRKLKTACYKAFFSSGHVSKNSCKWNANPCLHQPEMYSGIEFAAILKRGNS